MSTFVAVAAAEVAAAQVYPPTTAVGSVSASTVTVGGSVVFSGTGCAPGTPVDIADNGSPVTTVTADASGNFSASVTLSTEGTHNLTGTCVDAAGATRVVTASVLATAATSGGGGLPFTGGAATIPSLLLGLGAVAGGSTIVFVARRRERRTAAVL